MQPQKFKGKVSKPTFEAVISCQERLRKMLDVLIHENRCIKDEEERTEFLRLFAHATLGEGRNFNFFIRSPERSFTAGSVEFAAHWLTYREKNITVSPSDPTDSQMTTTEEKPIGFFWEILRDTLFTIYPHSQHKALAMSQEQSGSEKSRGHEVESFDE